MKNHKSISQRLARAQSSESKQEILIEWMNRWKAEQTSLIDSLGHAVAKDDFDLLCQLVGQLREMSAKKFDALSRIVDKFQSTPAGENNEGL